MIFWILSGLFVILVGAYVWSLYVELNILREKARVLQEELDRLNGVRRIR